MATVSRCSDIYNATRAVFSSPDGKWHPGVHVDYVPDASCSISKGVAQARQHGEHIAPPIRETSSPILRPSVSSNTTLITHSYNTGVHTFVAAAKDFPYVINIKTDVPNDILYFQFQKAVDYYRKYHKLPSNNDIVKYLKPTSSVSNVPNKTTQTTTRPVAKPQSNNTSVNITRTSNTNKKQTQTTTTGNTRSINNQQTSNTINNQSLSNEIKELNNTISNLQRQIVSQQQTTTTSNQTIKAGLGTSMFSSIENVITKNPLLLVGGLLALVLLIKEA